MSGRLRQFGRIARVRRVQHNLASAAAAKAAGEAQMLELSAERLGQLRSGLGAGTGGTSGATLASLGELAMRLDTAKAGLNTAISGARATVAAREAVRLAARRDQESVEKLGGKAMATAARLAERRTAAPRRPRSRFGDYGESD